MPYGVLPDSNIFDSCKEGKTYTSLPMEPEKVNSIGSVWKVKGHHVDGTVLEFELDKLVDFNETPFIAAKYFAGTLDYTTTFKIDHPDRYSVLNTGKARGVVEVYLNGEKIGTNWYGEAIFDIHSKLKSGDNELRIKLVTPLGNYATTVTKRYARRLRNLGLEGPVRIY